MGGNPKVGPHRGVPRCIHTLKRFEVHHRECMVANGLPIILGPSKVSAYGAIGRYAANTCRTEAIARKRVNHLARPGPSSRLFGATVVFIPSGHGDVDERRRRRRATSMQVVKSDSNFIDVDAVDYGC